MVKITGDEKTALGTFVHTQAIDTLAVHEAHRRLGPGDLVGRYLVIDELGAGGMGVVFAAYDPELDRKIALKLVRPDAKSSSSRERMVVEARAMAQLSHTNVVSVFDAGEHEGAIYIAMEFVQGQTLTDCLPELSHWRTLLPVVLDAGRGLAAAHERGLIHRDFKPDNVMIGEDGRVRVMDFGLARRDPETNSAPDVEALDKTDGKVQPALGDSSSRQLTRAGAVMGTPGYMAPEQFRGHDVDERADQFAFSVALWEGLYGARPYEGRGVWGLAEAVWSGRRQPPPRDRSVPRWLHAIVERGLAVDPDDRWPTIDSMLVAIERGRRRRRARWVTAAVATPLVVAAAGALGYQGWVQRVTDDCLLRAQDHMRWPERAADVEQGMAATGQTFAVQSFATIAGELDAWSEQWVQLHAEVCRDAAVDDAIEPELRQARTRCLVRKHETTNAVLDLLEEGNRALLVLAVDHLALVSNLDQCRDDGGLARLARPEQAVAAQVDGAQRLLSQAVLMHLTGEVPEALALARDALEQMQDAGFASGVAHAKTAVGSALNTLGKRDEARAMLEDAYFSAGALAHDALAAEAARHLAGLGAGPPPYGITWVRGWANHAHMLHARLDMAASFEEAEVYESLAAALADQDRPETVDEEIALMTRARDIRAALVPATHPAVMVSEVNLATYRAERDPQGALETIRARATDLRAAFGAGHPLMVSLGLTTGAILAEQGQFDAALRDIDGAISISAQTNGPDHPETARARRMRDEIVQMSEPTR